MTHGTTPTRTGGPHDDAGRDAIEVVRYDSRGFFAIYGSTCALLAAGFASLPWGMPLAVVMGANALWAVMRASYRKARIRIDEDGIVDENFWYSGGFIPWSAVRDVRPTRWGLIQIELFDENEYWDALHPMKAFALLKMQLYGFSPVVVTPWGLQGSRRALVAELQEGLDRWAVEAARRGELAGPTLAEE